MIHIAHITVVTYVTFVMFQYIGIPVPDFVGARRTWPANGEVPARDQDAGAINVEGAPGTVPRRGGDAQDR